MVQLDQLPASTHLHAFYRHLWTTLKFDVDNFSRVGASGQQAKNGGALLHSLRSIKNSLVGSRARKLLTIHEPSISSELGLLTSILEWIDLDHATMAVKLEAAAITGLLCVPEDQTVYTLLRERMPAALIDSITVLLRQRPLECLLSPPITSLQMEHQLLQTLLRTLSSLYSVISDVSSPRKWGYMTKSPEHAHQPRQRTRAHVSGVTVPSTPDRNGCDPKGKSKAIALKLTNLSPTDPLVPHRFGVGDSESLAHHLRLVSKPDELKQACEHAKALLLKYLVSGDCLIPLLLTLSSPLTSAATKFPPNSLSVSSTANLVVPCFLLIWCLCKDTRRQLWLVKKLMESPDSITHQDNVLKALIECMKSWLSSPHDQAVEYCIRAIGALLSIDEPPHYSEDKELFRYLEHLLWRSDMDEGPSDSANLGIGWTLLTSRAKDGTAALRSALATSSVGLVKHFPVIRLTALTYQNGSAIDIISNPSNSKTVRAEAAYALAHSVTISETLQIDATDSLAVKVLKKLLDAASEEPLPYATPTITSQNAMLRESAYLALASLMSTLDVPRQDVINLNLLPSIVKSLSDESILVKAAACQCCRALSRAISVLRTKLADEGAGSVLFDLALGGVNIGSESEDEDEDDEDATETQLKIVAMGAICNLVLDFSPMKVEVLSRDGIEKFVKLIKSTKYQSMRESALWALKNMTFSSSTQLKIKVISHLGWDKILELIEDKNPSIQENVISLLRNVAYGDIPDIEIVFRQFEVEDSPLLSCLEDRLSFDGPFQTLSSISGGLREGIILQTVYTFSNLATGSEYHKNFLLGRPRTIRGIYELLRHSNAEIRIGAIWCIINLAPLDEKAMSKMSSVAETVFDGLGFKERLEELLQDHRSDVRERAGCALLQLKRRKTKTAS